MRWLTLLTFAAALLAAGCGYNSTTSDNDGRGGFYSGVSGGGFRP